jgi:sugar phosphate isomerase/epimerase
VNFSRRSFLFATGGSALGSTDSGVPGPLGLELYSLRREIAKNLPGTLAFTRRLGFTEVEVPQLYGLSAKQFRAELDRADLKCTAMVAPEARIRTGLAVVADDAHTLGADYVIYPWIAHPASGFQRADCLRAAGDFNRWGEQLKAAKLQFCYHPHGYEFARSPEGTLLDTLIEKTQPGTVQYQMDVFWIAWPGQDPVHCLLKYPHRFPLMHLKDLRNGVHGNQTGQAPEDVSVPVGSGSIDFPVILQTARTAGVKRFYIEDESPEAAKQIPESLRYLRSLPLK